MKLVAPPRATLNYTVLYIAGFESGTASLEVGSLFFTYLKLPVLLADIPRVWLALLPYLDLRARSCHVLTTQGLIAFILKVYSSGTKIGP